MKSYFAAFALLATAACASTAPYGPATSDSASGYAEQAIEDKRYRVSYTDNDPQRARDYALRRAADLTLMKGGDWFEVVSSYAEGSPGRTGGGIRPSVGIGGTIGSGGYRSGGVGIGIGLPIGGGSSGKVTADLEILIGNGPKPGGANIYDARSVSASLSGPR